MRGFYLGDGLTAFILVNIKYGDERSHFSQPQRDSSSNARSGAGYDGNFPIKREQLKGAIDNVLIHCEASALPSRTLAKASRVSSTSLSV